ncbi:MAG: SRPBCC family protein [Candidatus Binatia bacterium]
MTGEILVESDSRVAAHTRSAAKSNVGSWERLASVALGSGLLLYGVKRRGIIPTLLGSVFLYRGVAGECALYSAIGIDTASRPHSPQTSVTHGQGIKITKAIIIDRPAAELYNYWRDLRNLANFMGQLESVERTGDTRSHWVFKVVAGKQVSWDAEIINDIPNELLAWRSLAGADVDHAGSVRFEPTAGERGTQVKVTLEYRLPGGILGAAAAGLLGIAPEQVVQADLKRFKQLLETGEISSVAGQSRGGRISRGQQSNGRA